MTTRTAKKPTVSDDHKAAMAQGRVEGRAVKEYLALLESTPHGRGRPRTVEMVQRRLAQVEEAIAKAQLTEKLTLLQERLNLMKEVESLQEASDADRVEAAFISVCKAYSERKHISWQAWRDYGVSADVLRRAGLSRRYEG